MCTTLHPSIFCRGYWPSSSNPSEDYYIPPGHLGKLASHSTRHSQRRVHVSEEACRVCFDLRNLEIGASISHTVGTVQASSKRSLNAANAVGILVVANWVGERNSWRPIPTPHGFVNVGCGQSGRLVFSSEAIEGDVIADRVAVAVKAKFVIADSALGTSKYGAH